MHDEFQAFVENPSSRNYRVAREAILGDPLYRPPSFELSELAELCEQGCFQTAREKIQEMMPEWALSPRVHFYAAWAASELGDEEDAELERFLVATCLRGVLATGDGSRSRPFLVSHVGDQYDVLQVLGLSPRRQRLLECHAQQMDVITCQEGAEIWFDVTDLMRHAGVQVDRPIQECWPGGPPRLIEYDLR